jgi:hypothetical protein
MNEREELMGSTDDPSVLARQGYPPSHVVVLWATSPRYPRPTVVTAWSDGLVEAWHDLYLEQRRDAETFFRDFGEPSDGPWTFWTTHEDLAPSIGPEVEALDPEDLGCV